ncbi:hypothetical protein GW17_00016189 [Ensete ventricosum]|nr:hypothetical protein GW17_00016189 [Ensete ventricosum]RZR92857.1 hypothetical protein BHM03_00021227 [Ensete ventricosum]
MLSISCNFAFCCTLCSAGFYICWGCLVWVPSIYTSPGMYLVNHPVNLGTQVNNLWGVSRHFHYVPEILAAFFWSVFLQQLFVLMITTMYCYRYGKYWKMYCNKVPYRVIPGIH